MIINMFSAATPECWLLMIFGVGGISGIVMFLLIQFDLKYEMRNNRNFVYMTALVALPAIIGINQRFNPIFSPLRIFYGLLTLIMMFAWQSLFFHGWQYFSIPVQRPQTSTVAKLIKNEFRLAGSAEVLSFISIGNQVN